MIIEGNEKEKAAMAEFHKGNRIKRKITVRVKRPAVIMETVKSAWQFTGHIRSMFPIA